MTRTTKTLIIVAIFCLVTGRSVTFAQFKFSKGGGSRNSSSRKSSNNSSRFSSNRSKSGNSFQKKSSSTNSGRSLNNFNSSKLGGSTAPKKTPSNGNSNSLSSRFGNTKGKSTFTNNLTKQLSNNTRFGKSDTQSKTTLDIRRKLDLKSGGTQMKTLPFIDNLKKNGIANAIGNNGNSNGNGNGKGNNSGNSNWQNVVKHMVNHKFQKNHWCNTRPASCHWWVNYCKPIAHCHHHEVVVCDWNRVHCNTVVHAGHAAQDVQWYLGLKGILLPGKGLGVEAVEAGSPAELVGLRPGMVMTVCNGIPLIDETSMQEAIRISGGVLQMTLLSADGSQVLQGTVQMTRIAAVTF